VKDYNNFNYCSFGAHFKNPFLGEIKMEEKTRGPP